MYKQSDIIIIRYPLSDQPTKNILLIFVAHTAKCSAKRQNFLAQTIIPRFAFYCKWANHLIGYIDLTNFRVAYRSKKAG